MGSERTPRDDGSSDGLRFADALRAEIDAVIGRYEALVRALGSASTREADALRAEGTKLAAENQELRAGLGRAEEASADLRRKLEALEAELASVRKAKQDLEVEVRAAADKTLAYEEEFVVERRFVEAAAELAGSLLGEALATAIGRPVEARSATYAALKARGAEATLVAAMKDRGRNVATAPLLERERSGLASVAKAAGCELVVPPDGARFSTSSMDKSSTVSDPAEEGNVVGCAVPGLRRAGTEGALLFPRVIVATG